MSAIIKIISLEHLTHDVLRIVAEKPGDLTYLPGQAVDVSINRAGWEQELRAFTFTALPEEDHIEFTIKTYPERNGVTDQLRSFRKGDELILHDVFGDIWYKGEGIFIAGGAGVTPFIAIFKQLESNKAIGSNKLLFANKTKKDIILEDWFDALLGPNFINILSEDTAAGYEHGFITTESIEKYMGGPRGYFYLCGPDLMMAAVQNHLAALGIEDDFIVKEAF